MLDPSPQDDVVAHMAISLLESTPVGHISAEATMVNVATAAVGGVVPT